MGSRAGSGCSLPLGRSAILQTVSEGFCSNCGAEASGRFCWRCGAQLHGQEGEATPSVLTGGAIDAASITDWSDEVRYQVLIGVPEVRERIARQAALSRKGVSAEQFMAAADKVIGPLMAIPIPLEPMLELSQRINSKLGLHTGKQGHEQLAWPVGRVIVAVLCSLARQGIEISSVHQAQDGCVIEAVTPSSPTSFAGTLVTTISRDGAGTRVDATTTIRGQLLDYGKSKARLRNLFDDIAHFAPADTVG
jgi:hypothetical protein